MRTTAWPVSRDRSEGSSSRPKRPEARRTARSWQMAEGTAVYSPVPLAGSMLYFAQTLWYRNAWGANGPRWEAKGIRARTPGILMSAQSQDSRASRCGLWTPKRFSLSTYGLNRER